MPAAVINLTINQGETFRQPFVWKAGSPATPVNLTGYVARMQVRSKASSATILLSLTTENGGITLGGVLGTIDFYLSDTDTSAIAWEYGVFDLELVAPSGDVTRLIQGTVTIYKEVTR